MNAILALVESDSVVKPERIIVFYALAAMSHLAQRYWSLLYSGSVGTTEWHMTIQEIEAIQSTFPEEWANFEHLCKLWGKVPFVFDRRSINNVAFTFQRSLTYEYHTGKAA